MLSNEFFKSINQLRFLTSNMMRDVQNFPIYSILDIELAPIIYSTNLLYFHPVLALLAKTNYVQCTTSTSFENYNREK